MDDATKLYTCKLISFLHVCTDSKINGVFAIVNDGATKLHQDTGQDGAADASASATSEQKEGDTVTANRHVKTIEARTDPSALHGREGLVGEAK